MRLSFFANVQDAAPRSRQITWHSFCEELQRPVLVKDKKQAPCFSPAQYPDGASRRSDAVTQLSLAVLDIDAITTADLEALCQKLSPYAHAGYTTLSHPAKVADNPDAWALRIILPLDRPVKADEWPEFWRRLHFLCYERADPQCKDPSRLYILPCNYPHDPSPLIDVHDGAPLSVALVMSVDLPQEHIVSASDALKLGQRVDRDRVRDRAKYLARQDDDKSQALAPNLRALLAGKPYGAPGRRNSTMLALTMELERLFPGAEPDNIAALFVGSHAAMAQVDSDAPDPLETVSKAVAGARRKRLERRFAAEQKTITAKQDRIRDVRCDGQTHPYTQDEIDDIAAMHGIPAESLQRHWILRHANQIYFLTKNGYSRGFMPMGILPTTAHYLSPASGVFLHTVDGRGASAKTTFRSFDAIMGDYGSDIGKVVYDLRAQFSRYDYRHQQLHIASAPKSQLEPKEHPEIHAWLTFLGGNKADKFLSWVAAAPDMQKKLCAVYLAGAPGTGKTVFAHGLSKLWQRGTPTPFSAAVSRFNSDLAQCPLILVDEGFPALPPKQLAIELRTLIGGDEVRVEQKFAGSYPLIGPRRMVMCANNSSLLDFKSELSPHDIEALAVRIMQIEPDERARNAFAQLSQQEFRSWQTHKIAEHALWLQHNLQVAQKPGNRFFVQGELDDSMRQVLVDGYYPSLACQVIVKFLTDRKRTHQKDEMIRWGGGELLVNQDGLHAAWHELLPKGPQPPVRLGGVLKALSDRKESRSIWTSGGMVRRFWAIDLDVLATWCDLNGYFAEEIRKLINTPIDAALMGTTTTKVA
jgi:hypothetical protein